MEESDLIARVRERSAGLWHWNASEREVAARYVGLTSQERDDLCHLAEKGVEFLQREDEDRMFERFNNPARQAVVIAQDEARRLNHDQISVYHLLMGVMRVRERYDDEPNDLGQELLLFFGFDKQWISERLDNLTTTVAPSGHLPFSGEVKRSLEFALREALEMGDNFIGSEHLVLGVARGYPHYVGNTPVVRWRETVEQMRAQESNSAKDQVFTSEPVQAAAADYIPRAPSALTGHDEMIDQAFLTIRECTSAIDKVSTRKGQMAIVEFLKRWYEVKGTQ